MIKYTDGYLNRRYLYEISELGQLVNPIQGFFDEYKFLSNFWICLFKINDITYNCVEQYYMSQKSHDKEYQRKILKLGKPGDMKRVGRTVKLRDDWEIVKQGIMLRGVFEKFYQNIDLKQKLLDTEYRYLEETNTWNDEIWGVCNGIGNNYLGKTLMVVREYLREIN